MAIILAWVDSIGWANYFWIPLGAQNGLTILSSGGRLLLALSLMKGPGGRHFDLSFKRGRDPAPNYDSIFASPHYGHRHSWVSDSWELAMPWWLLFLLWLLFCLAVFLRLRRREARKRQ